MTFSASPSSALPGPDDIDIIVDQAKRKTWIMHRKPFPLQSGFSGIRYDRRTHQFTLLGPGPSETLLNTITLAETLRRGISVMDHITLMQADQNGTVSEIRTLPLTFSG